VPKSINSRAKGARGEREFRDELRKRGHTARRGQQFSGANGDPDVVCETLPDYHFEVKRVEAGNPYKWLEQAKEDARDGETPVVAHRKTRKQWIAILDLDDFLKLVEKAEW
jgi:Holliday junction resolvase